jgi:hypothetical protein
VNPDSREFLFQEYAELWTMCRDLYRMHNRAIGLYLTFLSAIGVGVVKLASDGHVEQVLTLPWTFWMIALALLVVVLGVAQFVLVRWWIMSVEYLTAINAIRGAFVNADPPLSAALRLSVEPLLTSGRILWRAAFHLHLLVIGSAGVALGAAAFRCAVSLGCTRACAFIAASIVGIAWIVVSFIYRAKQARELDKALQPLGYYPCL